MEKICLNQSSIYIHPFPPFSPQFFYLPSSTQQTKKEKPFLVKKNFVTFTCPPPSYAYGTGIWKRLISPAQHLIFIYISNKEEIHEND